MLFLDFVVPSRISYQAAFFFFISASGLLIFVTPFLYILKMHSAGIILSADSISLPSVESDADNLAKMLNFAHVKTSRIAKVFFYYFEPEFLFNFISKLKLIMNYYVYEDLLLFLTFKLILKRYRSGLNSLRSILKIGKWCVTPRL